MARVNKDSVNGERLVIGYVRVSTDEQASSGAGLEVQKRAILAECERNGWRLVEMVEDAGYSAKTLKRPGLTRAIEMLKDGAANVLMVSKLDRLSRSTKDVLDLAHFAEGRFDLSLLDLRLDTTTPNGRMMLSVMAALSQLERELIGQRTREALAVKKSQGVRLGAPPQTPPRLRAQVLKLRESGRSMAAIADDLNQSGFRPVNGGKQFYASTVKTILDREAATA